jgi:hypothetical protein
MRRHLFIAALLFLLTIPLYAQRRGFSSPRMGGAVAARPAPRMGGAVAVRPGSRIVVRGGFGFGHNPGVFFDHRFHHRRFFNPFFNPFFSPFGFGFNSFPLYPYYPYGLQSDFVYSNYGNQQAAESDYGASQTAALSNEVSRLDAEVDMLRQQQAMQPERQQYALNSPAETPRPVPSTRASQEAPAVPTVLVYRDGHRVEVRNYAVVGQTLWIFSEERARKVPLADLDLNATRQANEERGVEFNVRVPAPAATPAPPPPGTRPNSVSYVPGASGSSFAN